ncbi:hypothetical protein D3C80_1640360 [compost metagenome]
MLSDSGTFKVFVFNLVIIMYQQVRDIVHMLPELVILLSLQGCIGRLDNGLHTGIVGKLI